MSKGRLEAFSDGVIAIIITITILLIDLPEGDSWTDLLRIMPVVVCYLISFVLVGVNWVNHHHLFQVAGSVTGGMLWSNLLYLFVLSFIPVTTGWVGRSAFSIIPVRVYIIVNLAAAGSYLLLEKVVIHSQDCHILRTAVEESRKEQWTFLMEGLALLLSFFQGAHYASCPLLLVAVAPWIVPDLRMKKVFEEASGRDKYDKNC